MSPDRDPQTMSTDVTSLRRHVDAVSRVLSSHAGGLDLVNVSPAGHVVVRFTGQCTGCPLKPISLAGLVRPTLVAVPGVASVEVEGGRISREAEARMGSYLAAYGNYCLVDAAQDAARAGDEPDGARA